MSHRNLWCHGVIEKVFPTFASGCQSVNMQHILQYLQGMAGFNIPYVVNICKGWTCTCLWLKKQATWALKTAQIAPKTRPNHSKSLKIARSWTSAPRHWVDIQYMSTFASAWAGSTFDIIDNICKGAASISNTNICSGIVNKLPDGYLRDACGTIFARTPLDFATRAN